MICPAQLCDIPSHLLSSNVETTLLHAPSLARKCFTKEAELSVLICGVQKASSLNALIPGTCKDDSERRGYNRKLIILSEMDPDLHPELDWQGPSGHGLWGALELLPTGHLKGSQELGFPAALPVTFSIPGCRSTGV